MKQHQQQRKMIQNNLFAATMSDFKVIRFWAETKRVFSLIFFVDRVNYKYKNKIRNSIKVWRRKNVWYFFYINTYAKIS